MRKIFQIAERAKTNLLFTLRKGSKVSCRLFCQPGAKGDELTCLLVVIETSSPAFPERGIVRCSETFAVEDLINMRETDAAQLVASSLIGQLHGKLHREKTTR